MSANEVYFGRKLLTPIDLKYGIQKGYEGVSEFCESVHLKRQLALKAIREAIVRFSTTHKNKHHSNRGVDPRLVVDSKVMVNAKDITQPGVSGRSSKKLSSKKERPFTRILE